jgi:membrane associated rhomboid family serine protease
MRPAPKLTEFYRYPITAGTALLAIGVTLAWWAKLDISPLIENSMVRHGELWRLVTTIFPHLDFLHLVFNLYWLWIFGTMVEGAYGHLKSAGLFLLFSVVPNSLEFAFASGGVGLSGVGYGLFGLLWVLSKRDERFRDAIDSRTIKLFVIWFFFCVAATFANFMNVGNIAHGAGAVLGILTGLAITLPERRAVTSAGICMIALFGLWATTLGRPKVNLSTYGSYEECRQGYDALVAQRDQDALHWFNEATAYRSAPAGCWYDLGIVHEQLGNAPSAVKAYRHAADLGDPEAQLKVGNMYEKGDRGLPQDDAQAISWYRKAAEHGSAEVLNNIAWTFATSSDSAMRNPTLALEYARKAVSADEHPKPYILDTLAEAYYVNQQYENAMTTEQRAIAQAPEKEKNNYLLQLAKYKLALAGIKLAQKMN